MQRSADLYEDLIRCCIADAMSEVYYCYKVMLVHIYICHMSYEALSNHVMSSYIFHFVNEATLFICFSTGMCVHSFFFAY